MGCKGYLIPADLCGSPILSLTSQRTRTAMNLHGRADVYLSTVTYTFKSNAKVLQVTFVIVDALLSKQLTLIYSYFYTEPFLLAKSSNFIHNGVEMGGGRSYGRMTQVPVILSSPFPE